MLIENGFTMLWVCLVANCGYRYYKENKRIKNFTTSTLNEIYSHQVDPQFEEMISKGYISLNKVKN